MLALVACGGGEKELSAEEKRAKAIAEGNVALCNNGDFSNNTDFRATCSGADGLDEWLAEYGECTDGTIIKMDKDSSCRGSDFLELKEAGFEPAPNDDDVALCNNGTYSNNTDFSATCNGGGGVDHWLADYGECNDGTVIVMEASASCNGRDGFKELKPEDFRPAPKADDVALCNSGTYSNNTDFSATCSGAGGIAEWLAEYGECNDGTIIKMGAGASCRSHDGFKELKPEGFVPPTTTTTTTTAPSLPTTTTTTQPRSDEPGGFLAYATEQMRLGESAMRYYLTGEAQIVGNYLIVNAQLNRSDSEDARRLCGQLVSASYSYAGDLPWTIIQIQPIDGGTAAECERRTS